jgi:hypothetical protein
MPDLTDAEFLTAFRAQAIPSNEWTHRAHVRAAYLHLCEMPFEEAMDAMRDGIKKLNASNGVVETPERGYHETLTRAWLTVISATIRSRGRGDGFEAFAAQQPHLLTSTLLRVFYSASGMTPESRYSFVEPDLAPLPAP